MLQDPNFLVAKFYRPEEYALALSAKFTNIALYLETRVRQRIKAYQQVQRVANHIARRARSNAVSRSSF